MHPDLITAQLRIKGQPSVQIAERLQVSQAFVSQVIHGVRRNARVRKAIARALGLSVSQIWPSTAPGGKPDANSRICATAQIRDATD